MRPLIAIKGCEAHRDRWNAQQSTWALREGVIVSMFTGPELGVPDDYEHLPHKTKAICSHCKSPDYVFLCDTDTYVSIPRLLASRFYLHDYVGYQLDAGGIPYASGGAGYWLSAKAMRIIARESVPKHFASEDQMVGATLYEHRIPLHHDSRYALYEDVLPGNDIISRHLSSREPFKIESMYEAHRNATGACKEVGHG